MKNTGRDVMTAADRKKEHAEKMAKWSKGKQLKKDIAILVKFDLASATDLQMDAAAYGMGTSTFLRSLYSTWRLGGKKFLTDLASNVKK